MKKELKKLRINKLIVTRLNMNEAQKLNGGFRVHTVPTGTDITEGCATAINKCYIG